MSLDRTSLSIFCNNGLYGLKDKDGKTIVACEYSKILDYDGDGYIRILKGDIYGTVDLEGRPVISHAKGFTHLGVFHNGAARARNAEGWGLINEQGKPLTPFSYSNINAHVPNGYVAFNAEGQKGFLTDKGHFTVTSATTDNIRARSRKYKKIGVFHNDIAPALTWNNVWGFIDRQYDRVNDYEYNTLDIVLRDGLYLAAKRTKEESYYTAISFDGTPFNNDHYDSPIHFENALAECSIQGLYGIVQLDGTYLFPCQYKSLHWNDYDVKDCWYAEDNKFCYLLYPNGSIRTYNKRQTLNRWNSLPYIPKKEIPNYIAPQDAQVQEHIKRIHNYVLKDLSTQALEVQLRKFIGDIEPPHCSIHFFYRDTDAPFNIEKEYKIGHCIRAGKDLEVSAKLLRPVHRVRFLIASLSLISKDEFSLLAPQLSSFFDGWSKYIIHHNACFLVSDIFSYMGKTQILLLQLPYDAIRLAMHYGYRLDELPHYDPKCIAINNYARYCFKASMSLHVHGHSLSPRWVDKMNHPIGLDHNFNHISIEPSHVGHIFIEKIKNATDALNYIYQYNPYNDHSKWLTNYYLRPSNNQIEVVQGDITYISTEAIVELQVFINDDGNLLAPTSAINKENRNAYKNINFHIEDVEGKPYKKRILATTSTERPTLSLISYCYRSILSYASSQGLHDIAIAPTEKAFNYYFMNHKGKRNIVWKTIEKCLTKHIFQGRVVICCKNDTEADTFKDLPIQ